MPSEGLRLSIRDLGRSLRGSIFGPSMIHNQEAFLECGPDSIFRTPCSKARARYDAMSPAISNRCHPLAANLRRLAKKLLDEEVFSCFNPQPESYQFGSAEARNLRRGSMLPPRRTGFMIRL